MTAERGVGYGVVAVGLVFMALAVIGFGQIANDTHVDAGLYGGNDADLVWGVFGVNTVMNFIHALLGVVTIISGVILHKSQVGVWAAAGGFTALFVYGVVAILVNSGTTSLAITWGDNVLHAVAAVVLGVAAWWNTARERHRTSSSRSPAVR